MFPSVFRDDGVCHVGIRENESGQGGDLNPWYRLSPTIDSGPGVPFGLVEGVTRDREGRRTKCW